MYKIKKTKTRINICFNRKLVCYYTNFNAQRELQIIGMVYLLNVMAEQRSTR